MCEYKNPKPTVDTIVHHRRSILMVQRQDGKWAFPGGFVDEGESYENAALREPREEILVEGEDRGIELVLLEQFHTYSHPNRDHRQHNATTVYIARHPNKDTDVLVPGEEVKAVRYIPLELIHVLHERGLIAFDHYEIIQDFMQYSQGIEKEVIFNPMRDVVAAK